MPSYFRELVMITRTTSQKGVGCLLSVILLVICSFSPTIFAAEKPSDKTTVQPSTPTEVETEKSEKQKERSKKIAPEIKQQLDSTRGRLTSLMTLEQRKEILIIQLQNELANSEDEEHSHDLDIQIKELKEEIKSIRDEFDRTLTGGIDQTKLATDIEKSYNWRDDLEDIMKPIFRSMKDVTEKPREIERLRSEISFLKRNIELSESALNFIRRLDNNNLPDTFQVRVRTADLDWSVRLASLEEELAIVEFQLETRLNESSNFFNNFGETLQEFATGRGLSIFSAILAFWLVWMIFVYMRKGYRHLAAKRKKQFESGLTSRILFYAYQILASIVAVTAMLLVFFVKGDWIMLGISMLILVAIVFSIKNYFPKFVIETKLLLNIGPVREGERLFYKGIPWKVDKIRVYTELFNPLLSGGRLRIQLKELVDMSSRRFDACEAWFPCREDDMLLMSENRLVKVISQSPEFVNLNFTGGATTTIKTTDFLSMPFTNLSEESFRVSSFFGVDYALQKKATTRVQAIFRDEIREYLESQNYGKYLKVLRVEFHEASDSALTYKIIADFHGIAARHHNIIKRALQTAAVDVCNNHDWVIPFNQLTIHQAETETKGAEH